MTQSYQLLLSDVRTDLSHLAISLSTNIKTYPRNEKKST